MKYKLNLHAHTRYSDGGGTLREMVEAYKAAGFCCAVLTDHFYTGMKDLTPYSISRDEFIDANIKAKEYSKELNYPIIIGVEYSFFRCEEVLCFGYEFIKELMLGVDSIEHFGELKEKHHGACIVAHPHGEEFIKLGAHKVVDGYEYANSGGSMFHWRDLPEEFKNLTPFSNADAHQTTSLERGYNLVDEDIQTEKQLIDYIRNKKPVEIVFDRNGEEKV